MCCIDGQENKYSDIIFMLSKLEERIKTKLIARISQIITSAATLENSLTCHV
jgi:hypothetical protein